MNEEEQVDTLQTKNTVVKTKTDHSVPEPHRVCFGIQEPICIGP